MTAGGGPSSRGQYLRVMPAWLRPLLALPLAALPLLPGCSDSDAGSVAVSDPAEAEPDEIAADADPEFCADLADLEETMEQLASDMQNSGVADDAQAIADLFDNAADELDAVTPPDDMETDWELAIEGLRAFADAYRQVDVDDPDSFDEFQKELDAMEDEGEEAQAAIDRISAYAEESCGIDLGSPD